MPRRTETAEQRFNQICRETSEDVLAYLLRRSTTTEDAADALAETYAVAWKKLERPPRGKQARLWLFGVARIELHRAAGRARSDDELVTRLAHELEVGISRQPGPDDMDACLWLAASQLPLRDREILALTAWEGLAPREIALVMGMSANAVRLRLTRARRSIRELLDAEQRSNGQPPPMSPHVPSPSHLRCESSTSGPRAA